MPDGERVKEITPTDISINCISVNPQGALVAAGMSFAFRSLCVPLMCVVSSELKGLSLYSELNYLKRI